MRSIMRKIRNIKRDYYLMKASEYLTEAGKHLGTEDFNVWMNQYRKYLDKAIELYDSL